MNDLWIAFLMMLSEMTAMEVIGSIVIFSGIVLLYICGSQLDVSDGDF